VTDEFVRNAGRVSANDEVYASKTRIRRPSRRGRRIKTPHSHHAAYARASRHPTIVAILAHGSATNLSGKQRRFLLFQYRAVDAWPLLGFPEGIAEFDGLLLTSRPTLEPRLASVPVRLPLPPAEHQGSIYENQRGSCRRYFAMVSENRAIAAK
jgi:hypothetical protein